MNLEKAEIEHHILKEVTDPQIRRRVRISKSSREAEEQLVWTDMWVLQVAFLAEYSLNSH